MKPWTDERIAEERAKCAFLPGDRVMITETGVVGTVTTLYGENLLAVKPDVRPEGTMRWFAYVITPDEIEDLELMS